MQGSNISHQQQIQVVIRLKPNNQQSNHTNCVYTTQSHDNELVVETPNKKEYFQFDSIADQLCTQQQLYQKIGHEAVMSSLKGYNCCIFAYGQTGAGKTYSILGRTQDLNYNIYAQSRGVLPRLLNEIFDKIKEEDYKCSVICSYMQIYNEQMIDLLNTDGKVTQIREDLKRGVFVDGISEETPKSYPDSMEILKRGLKNRKIGTTNMNDESSRSHTIFTINLEFDIENGTKSRKSKIHIVDLAGSERAKLTKVEGERLKQGCNINKSLHVLGNVINALVQSSKKKKHIPFRDSKLTYFLKDSLGGNSITKLLANIDPTKKYMSETLSTLMFAKRAKIIRMKVQVNENLGQNFQGLRKQIKKLREELAQARYIMNQQKLTERNSNDGLESGNWDKLLDTSNVDFTKNQRILQVFQDHQLNYKALISIYEEHLRRCPQTIGTTATNHFNMHRQWKNLEKKNQCLINLTKNIPAFSKIFRQNLILKAQIQKENELTRRTSKDDLQQNMKKNSIEKDLGKKCEEKCKQQYNFGSKQIEKVINWYEGIIVEMKDKMANTLQNLQQNYNLVVKDNREKDQKIKQLKRRKELPPDIQSLENDIQYLKLNIMQLESEIAKYQENQLKYQLQIQNLKDLSSDENQKVTSTEDIHYILNQLQTIKKQALQELQEVQQEKQSIDLIIFDLKTEVLKLRQQNKKIHQQMNQYANGNKQLKRKLHELLKISSQAQINKQSNTNTFWTNEQSNFTQELMGQTEEKGKVLGCLEKDEKTKAQQRLQNELEKSVQLSHQIINMHKEYGQQIITLKNQIRHYQTQRKDYISQLQTLQIRNRLIEQEFGKPVVSIIQQYRDWLKMPCCESPKTMMNQVSSAGCLKSFYSPIVVGHKKKQSKQKKNEESHRLIEEKRQKSQLGSIHRKQILKTSMIGKSKDTSKKEDKQKFVQFPPKKKQKKIQL